MPISWNVEGDFDEVVDTLESVTLLRRGGDPAGELMRGWRYRQESSAPVGAEGAVRLIDTTWQTPIEAGVRRPDPGDRLRDEAGVCTTVREVKRLRGGTRYSCLTRRVELAPLAAERFTRERPIYGGGSDGTAITGWEATTPTLVGWLDRSRIDSGQASCEVVFRLPVSLATGDRVRDDRGILYQVTSVVGQDSVGDPFVAAVEPFVADV